MHLHVGLGELQPDAQSLQLITVPFKAVQLSQGG